MIGQIHDFPLGDENVGSESLLRMKRSFDKTKLDALDTGREREKLKRKKEKICQQTGTESDSLQR